MLNLGIKKKIEVITIVLCAAACSVVDQRNVLTQKLSSTETGLSTVEPGRTNVPVFTHTNTAPQPTPAHTLEPLPTFSTGTTREDYVFPKGELFLWREVASGLERPVGLTNAQDGSQRVFILEQPGRISIIREGILSPLSFLNINQRVGSQGFEQGLLGLAFHPEFSLNRYFYVNYTDLSGDTVIARFSLSLENPDQADPVSEKRLLQVNQPYRNHNGGSLAFGPDGYLYIGLGDGGSAGDPQNNAQSLNNLLGKILRIDVDAGDPYGIPQDNPFSGGGGAPEIWAYGLRNPWRFSFDRLTGDLYIGDVGQSLWEEINFIPAGSPAGGNFGWRYFEGSHPYQGTLPSNMDVIPPVVEYSHDLGCSVTGGVIYRGSKLPEFQGLYLFGDYCSARVWGMRRNEQGVWASKVLYEGLGTITSFGEDEAGEVYLVNHSGQVLRLERQ